MSKIDVKKVKIIRRKIHWRELMNLKTGQFKDSEMKQQIKKVIENEVKKCY